MIRHTDGDLLIVEKPSGMLSVPGRGPERQDCVASRVQAIYPDALTVHRLDLETSGLMVMARNKATHRALSIAFQERRVEKRYLAVVDGFLQADIGIIDLPLIVDWPNRPRQKVDFTTGKPALTQYRVLMRHTDRSRVELAPLSGRSHQLRLHLCALGHPILGDPIYANPAALAKSPRLLLHATLLAFTHPGSGNPLTLHSAAPF